MSVSDPVGNLLVSLVNASRAGKPHVDLPSSKFGTAIVDCLKEEGFVQNWRELGAEAAQKQLRVYLKYTKSRKPILRHIRRVSRPGLRIYVPKTKVPRVLSGIGMAVLSTPKGVYSDAKARAEGVGGELVCRIW